MDRLLAVALLCTIAPAVDADVLYVCDPQRDYIELADGNYGHLDPITGPAETISTTDDGLATVIVRQCHLSSGTYAVLFTALRTEQLPTNVDGRVRWIVAEIKSGSAIVLPQTVVGKCDIPRSRRGVCAGAWATEIRVEGKRAGVELLQLVSY